MFFYVCPSFSAPHGKEFKYTYLYMFATWPNFNHTAVHNPVCSINPVLHYLYILLQALRRTGLLTSDPRLRDCFDQVRQSTQDSTGPVMMDMSLFRRWEKLSLFMETQSCIPLLQWEYLTLTCTYSIYLTLLLSSHCVYALKFTHATHPFRIVHEKHQASWAPWQ